MITRPRSARGTGDSRVSPYKGENHPRIKTQSQSAESAERVSANPRIELAQQVTRTANGLIREANSNSRLIREGHAGPRIKNRAVKAMSAYREFVALPTAETQPRMAEVKR
jgi:hypothetical protein